MIESPLAGGIRMILSEQLNIRFDQALLKRVDEWRRRQPDLPGRTEAVRRLVVLSLNAAQGAVARSRRSGSAKPGR